MLCRIHCVDKVDQSAKVLKFSDKSWEKTIICAHRWKYLRKFPAMVSLSTKIINQYCLELVWHQDNLIEKIPPSDTSGYHQKCYEKFTHKGNLSYYEQTMLKEPDSG